MLILDKPRTNIIQFETGEKLSSDELTERIKKRSDELRMHSIAPGSVALLLNPNTIDFFINLLAFFSLGASVVPMDPQSSPLELEKIKAHAGVNIIVNGTNTEIVRSEKNAELINIALVLYTSGTTGRPKGVKLSYDAIRAKIDLLSQIITPEERENILCLLPTFFGHGLICNSLFAIYFSTNFYIAKKMDILLATNFKSELKKYQINFFSTVPSIWDLILNFSEEKNISLPFLKRVHCASAVLKSEKADLILNWLGQDVSFYNVFGITEMSGWFSGTKIMTGKDATVFEDFWSAQVKFKSDGELLIKAPYMFSGYLNNPEETELAIDNNGFFKTGDIFNDGKYFGRSKLVINKKGMKIYPNEIDEFIFSSGMVSDCHTFGISDKFAGEIIGTLVVLKMNSKLEDLRAFCMQHLPATKFPDRMFAVEKIGRTNRGKIALESLNKYRGDNHHE